MQIKRVIKIVSFFIHTLFYSIMSRRWRLFLIFAFFVFILLQTWFLITPSVPKAAAKMSLNQTKATDTDQQPLPLTRTRPKKQSTLNGFGGFTSDLPPIQHAFSPEPADYTKLREKRRLAIKKSFLHGWNGYSKFQNCIQIFDIS